MVVRHQTYVLRAVLLAPCLGAVAGGALPFLALRKGLSGSLWERHSPHNHEASATLESLLGRRALGLGESGHSCLESGVISRRGAWGVIVASGLRGGASGGIDSDDGESSLEDDEEDFVDDDGVMDEEDFGEANFVGRLKQDWKKTPIITKTFFQTSVGIALVMMFFNGNQWPSFLLLDWQPAIFRLQLWRLVTPFMYLGPVGLNFFLTVHFAWTYMSQLEKLHYREPHTFVMLLAFGMGSLLVLTLLTGADVNSSYTLGHSLSCFLVMVWSRKFAGTKVNVLDMFELSTELLPYFFVVQSLMMDGVIPWVDLSGLFIGYAWQTLSMKGLLNAPKPLVNLFRKNAFLRAEYARAGKEYGQEMPLNHDDDDDDAEMPSPDVAADQTEEDEDSDGETETTSSVESDGDGKTGVTGATKTEGGSRGDVKEAQPVPISEEEEEEEMEEQEQEQEQEVSEEARERPSDDETEEYSSEEDAEEGNDVGHRAEGSDGGEVEEEEVEEELELGSDESDEMEGDFDEEIESILDEFEGDLDPDDLSSSFEESEEDTL